VPRSRRPRGRPCGLGSGSAIRQWMPNRSGRRGQLPSRCRRRQPQGPGCVDLGAVRARSAWLAGRATRPGAHRRRSSRSRHRGPGGIGGCGGDLDPVPSLRVLRENSVGRLASVVVSTDAVTQDVLGSRVTPRQSRLHPAGRGAPVVDPALLRASCAVPLLPTLAGISPPATASATIAAPTSRLLADARRQRARRHKPEPLEARRARNDH
jgi:hypothetical protein